MKSSMRASAECIAPLPRLGSFCSGVLALRLGLEMAGVDDSIQINCIPEPSLYLYRGSTKSTSVNCGNFKPNKDYSPRAKI